MSGSIYGNGDCGDISIGNQRSHGGDIDYLFRIREAFCRFPIEQLGLLYALKDATASGYVG